ncbi:MAG: farnesyl diphosphate synthase [Pseudomonadota bacterium]|nr:farnesyl diphosphate synthase [Pseudomonadota bacterium]
MNELNAYLQQQARLFDQYLERHYSFPENNPQGPVAILGKSMAYSLLAGGKRLRPILAMSSCRLFGGELELVLPVALAIEMIHTYSLIHDDLPAMDDDDFRRGLPTNHKVYGEGMAILAGDALLTDAFGHLAAVDGLSGETRLELVRGLSRAAGSEGMVAGQAIDLHYEGRLDVSQEVLFDLHRRKTGAMITFAVLAGGMVAGADKEDLARLETYGQSIGLAFQIADDMLDETGTQAELGKDAGSDREKNKLTSVSLLGIDESRVLLEGLVDKAVSALAPYGKRAALLQQIANYIAVRKN